MKSFVMACLSLVMLAGMSFAGDPLKSKKDFETDGPKLYTMDEALKVSDATGKPVVCWMGKDLFENKEARKLSLELAETTIQAAMDTDGTEYDKLGFRVKFSSNKYKDTEKTYTIRMSNFSKPGVGDEILRVSRGGAPKFSEK